MYMQSHKAYSSTYEDQLLKSQLFLIHPQDVYEFERVLSMNKMRHPHETRGPPLNIDRRDCLDRQMRARPTLFLLTPHKLHIPYTVN